MSAEDREKEPMPLRVREMLESEAESVVALWHAAGVTRPWNNPHKDIAFAMSADQAAILVTLADDICVYRMEMDRIQFMVAHDRQGEIRVNKATDDLQYAGVVRASVNEVTEKNDLAVLLWFYPAPDRQPITKLPQKLV